MAIQSPIQRAFIGGEIAPAMGGRADLVKYLTGLRRCHNMIVQRHGGAANRPGTRFLGEVKDSTHLPRLMPFIFEGNDQTYLIEMGGGYFRFFFHGARVVTGALAAWSGAVTYGLGDLVSSGGVNYYSVQAGNFNHAPPNAAWWYPLTADIYEVPNGYSWADVSRIRWSQSADVLTLTHGNYPVAELKRFSQTKWTFSAMNFAPTAKTPTNVIGSVGTAGTLTMRYKVTSAKLGNFEESLPSSVVTLTFAKAPTTAAPNVISWDADAGAAEFYVYGDFYGNGLYGFLGTALTNSFNDVGFIPDFTVTPPVDMSSLFGSVGNYPALSTYYQQRLCFARTNNKPEGIWASQVGAYSNNNISTPLQDDDGISFVLAGTQLNPVAHLLGLKKLLVLTDSGEWLVRGDQADGVLKPQAINADQEGYVGASVAAIPVIVNNSVVYVQGRGNVLCELTFDNQQQSFVAIDMTVFAAHLFAAGSILGMSYQRVPSRVLWCVRSDGTLLAVTYLKEQEVLAWHQHNTGHDGDKFEDVCVLPDSAANNDIPYVVCQRFIDGVWKRYIEKLEVRGEDPVTALFLDSGLSYSGVPVTTIGGLDHLEGEVIGVVGDGKVMFNGDEDDPDAEDFRVTGGQVVLPSPASNITAGLMIRDQLIETLDLDVQGTSIRNKRKIVQRLTVVLENSNPRFWAGPDEDHLLQAKPERWKVSQDALVNGPAELTLNSGFTDEGRVVIVNKDPLPFTVLLIAPDTDIEDHR